MVLYMHHSCEKIIFQFAIFIVYINLLNELFIIEQSRVVQLAKGERSYHVFYQLCAGAPSSLKGLVLPLHPFLKCFKHCCFFFFCQGVWWWWWVVPYALLSSDLAERLNLKLAHEYKYLNQSGCLMIDGVDDATRFQILLVITDNGIIFLCT